MANRELELINAICANKDLTVLMTNNLEELCDGNEDVIISMKAYYSKYRSVPDIDILKTKFPHLERMEVKGEAAYYLDTLRNDVMKSKMKRLFLEASESLKGDSSARVLAGIQKELSSLNKYTGKTVDLDVMDFDRAAERYEQTREKAAAMGGTPGIPTGVEFIDAGYTSGLAGGDLVIVLGWTGRGKSLLTTLICCNAYQNYKKPMIISLEMRPEKVQDRIYTIMGNGLFRNSDLALGAVDIDDFRTFSSKHKDGRAFPVMGNEADAEITPNLVQSKIDEHRPDILVIDYAQLTSDNANSVDMTARMRNMSKEYKRMAMANDIPIILISSATPDSTASLASPPLVEQVAWSKQLSYDADLAFAVHKHEGTNIIEVVCRKNRNGDLFSGYIDWDINSGTWRVLYDLDGAV